MVQEALEKKHQRFAQLHREDTDEELSAYIRSCARQLRHTPHPGEIYGTPMILERFGSWEQAMRISGLTPNLSKPKRSQFLIVREETAYQKLHYRENRDKILKERAQRNQQRIQKQRIQKELYAAKRKSGTEPGQPAEQKVDIQKTSLV